MKDDDVTPASTIIRPIMPHTLRSNMRVRLRDCDAFGHLHNSTFLDYFLEAREDQLHDAYNFSISDYASKHHISWYITENQIRYFDSVHFGATVTIETRVIQADTKGMTMEGLMLGEDGLIKALYWTRMRAINTLTNAPTSHDDYLNTLLDHIISRAPMERENFRERVEQVRNSHS